jgi:hypothetical protein
MNIQTDGLGDLNGILGLCYNPAAFDDDPSAVSYV